MTAATAATAATAMTAATAVGAVVEQAGVEERLDRIAAQVEQIADEMQRQREAREQWQELVQTLVPVGRGVFDVADRELQDLAADVTVEDALRFARTTARSLPQLEALVAQLQSVAELGAEISSLGGAGVGKVSDVLAEADRKGYFVVARGGATVLDRMVSSVADEDFDALGERLVLLLGVAREAVDPAVVGVLGRAVAAVRDGQTSAVPAPSTLGLLRQVRDPQTRRGLARALDIVHALGAAQPVDVTSDE